MKSLRNAIYAISVAAASMTSFGAAAADNTVVFSYSNLQEEFAMWGTSAKENYDVAIRLVQPELVGARIRSFSVPMFATDGIDNISVWLSKELTLVNKVNQPDIVSVPAEIVDDYLRVTFPEPYTITEEGVYVGYSFNVTETGTQATNKPIALTYGSNPNGLFIHTKRTYGTWQEKSTSLGGLSMISVELEGDYPQVGARITYPAELNVPYNAESFTIPVTLVSSGTTSVTSLTFEYDQNGVKREITRDYNPAESFQLARDYTFSLSVPNELLEGMNYPTLRLAKINGQDNPYMAEDPAQIAIYNYTTSPLKRPLVEEYTGLWCGWCPKGYVALERMAKEDKNFVGVAIHSGDDMQTITSKEFPSDASSLPKAWLDRADDIDPAYQSMKKAVENAAAGFAYADIEAVTTEDKENKKVGVTAKVKFVRPVLDQYAIFYYLLGNGLTFPKWLQTNYYSGRSPEDYPDMEEFIEAGEKVEGLIFNDVLLVASDTKGVEGSLPAPAEIKAGEWVENQFTFDTSDIISCYSNFNLTTLPKGYSVIVGVVNCATGEVTNSIKVGVGDAGVKGVSVEPAEIASREYFNLQGIKVAPDSKGILIEVLHLANGRTVRSKVVR